MRWPGTPGRCWRCWTGGSWSRRWRRRRRCWPAVTGQDLEEDAGGVFRIARRVAPDRVISTVDPQARHGHKTSARGFDGYKGHVAVDPDAEIITATAVTPGNSGDAEAAAGLLADLLPGGQDSCRRRGRRARPRPAAAGDGQPAVYGDAAYGSGELIGRLDDAGICNGIKCQPPAAVTGHFPKDRFAIDLETGTVTCPAGVTAPIRASHRSATPGQPGSARRAGPARWPPSAPSRQGGRTITIGPHEARLAAARLRQAGPGLEGGLQGHPPEGRAEDRPPHAPPPRRPPRPRPRTRSRSPPTSPCSPPRSTSPASPCSGSPAERRLGGCQRLINRERPASGPHRPRSPPSSGQPRPAPGPGRKAHGQRPAALPVTYHAAQRARPAQKTAD